MYFSDDTMDSKNLNYVCIVKLTFIINSSTKQFFEIFCVISYFILCNNKNECNEFCFNLYKISASCEV